LLYRLLGAVALGAVAYAYPRLRLVEIELPNALTEEPQAAGQAA
jgi:hypothetical protein